MKRGFPHVKMRASVEILNVPRAKECKKSAGYVNNNDEQFRFLVKDVNSFYATLSALRSRCIDGNDERLTFGCQMTVYLNHDQYQALGEILERLEANRNTAWFPRTYTARKCNSTTTWTNRTIISYNLLLDIRESTSEDLESLLLGAEALLSVLCETVPNFEVLWLSCLNGLSLTENPGLDTYSSSSLLHVWINAWLSWRLQLYRFERSQLRDHVLGTTSLATHIKSTIRLLGLHLVSSMFSENSTQPYSYLGGRVSAINRNCTNMDSKRKELPMIIGGKEIKAQHDSGAECGNFMHCDLASKLHLRLRNKKGDCKRFSIGNGKIVKALGRVKAICAFAKEAQTKMECWFYVFNELASPLIMGSRFLNKTKTLSDHVHRLEDCMPNPGVLPMVNLIGSTQRAKRRFAANIDHRLALINADSGSDLDLMSSTYVRAHGYQLDRRRRCRKRVSLANNTVAETIGQVQATLTLGDGSTYLKTFDVLPNLTSEVLLGQFTLEEINAFTFHRNSFVDVFAGQRHLELSVLGYLGKVNEFLAFKRRGVHRRKGQMQKQGKSPQYDLKRLEIATNSWISIACETTG